MSQHHTSDSNDAFSLGTTFDLDQTQPIDYQSRIVFNLVSDANLEQLTLEERLAFIIGQITECQLTSLNAINLFISLALGVKFPFTVISSYFLSPASHLTISIFEQINVPTTLADKLKYMAFFAELRNVINDNLKKELKSPKFLSEPSDLAERMSKANELFNRYKSEIESLNRHLSRELLTIKTALRFLLQVENKEMYDLLYTVIGPNLSPFLPDVFLDNAEESNNYILSHSIEQILSNTTRTNIADYSEIVAELRVVIIRIKSILSEEA